jgi:hypothetical protein
VDGKQVTTFVEVRMSRKSWFQVRERGTTSITITNTMIR